MLSSSLYLYIYYLFPPPSFFFFLYYYYYYYLISLLVLLLGAWVDPSNPSCWTLPPKSPFTKRSFGIIEVCTLRRQWSRYGVAKLGGTQFEGDGCTIDKEGFQPVPPALLCTTQLYTRHLRSFRAKWRSFRFYENVGEWWGPCQCDKYAWKSWTTHWILM